MSAFVPPFSGLRALGLLLVSSAAPAQDSAPTAPPPSRALLLELTEQTRLAGTVGSKVAADHVARHLRAAGFEVEYDDHEVVLAIPRRIELEFREGAGDARVLHRRLERFDPDAIPPGDVPPCNGYAASGDVRARVVDVGRGLRADYERLAAAGVDVRGAIALARYGGAYRGIKVDLAAQYGCVGVLLFHERRADGEAWPAGPWKPGFEAERGSISPMGRTPGDPSTPGWASPSPGETARRLAGEELASALPRIPCVPIGWSEAETLIAHLAPRTVANAKGQPSERPTGPGPVEVHLVLDQPRDVRAIRNVVATLRGASAECVVAGNHRDAWVRGANDAGSGTVAMLRAAERLSARVRAGWTPPRTLKLCFWDAEEWGLVGSTEWAEAHADFVRENVYAYVNVDVGVSGTHFHGIDGTPGLLGTLTRVLARIPTPAPRAADAPADLLADWRAQIHGAEPSIGLAGSGSDFAAFLHHLSVPTLDIGLGGNSGGQYHTGFDDFAVVERTLDPGFVGHELCGQLLEELFVELLTTGRQSFDAREAVQAIAAQVRADFAPPAAQDAAPAADAPADSLLGADARARIDAAFAALARACDTDATRHVALYRLLEDPRGVPGRSWYRNVLWTPGLETGYSSETLPGVRAAARDGAEALARAVDEIVARLDAARARIEAGTR